MKFSEEVEVYDFLRTAEASPVERAFYRLINSTTSNNAGDIKGGLTINHLHLGESIAD